MKDDYQSIPLPLFYHDSVVECAVYQHPGRLKLLRACSTLFLITHSAT